MQLFGIWRKDQKNNHGDWLREFDESPAGVIAFGSVRAAQRRAATLYGFDSYTEAKRADWVEVRPLND